MNEGEVSFIAREGKETPLGSLPNVKNPSQEELQSRRAHGF
jgi:hypothetical protein